MNSITTSDTENSYDNNNKQLYNLYELGSCCDEIVTEQDTLKYDDCRKCWNRAIDKHPLVIAYCKNTNQVKSTLEWARLYNLPIRIRSGCHSYEGFCIEDNAVIIDVSRFKEISLDEKNLRATIGAGVQNIEVYNALRPHGFIFPGGACPTVGVVGFVLGGGWSFCSRELGLGCDNIIEFEIVDYNGNVLLVNENSHSELFWACKGAGGGNFGIIVSMTIKIQKKYDMASLITMNFPHCCLEKLAEIVSAWQELFNSSLDKRFNGKINIYNTDKDGIGCNIIAVFLGGKEEAQQMISPFLSTSSCPDEMASTTPSYTYAIEHMSVHDVFKKICDIHPDFESFKSSGRFVYKVFDRSEIDLFIELLKQRPTGSVYTAISLYGWGGRVNEIPEGDTAFPHRQAKSLLGVQTEWEGPQHASVNKEWLLEKFKILKPLTSGSFINFPLLELNDYKREYFGNNFEKLEHVKRKYDPLKVFTFSQGL